MSLKQEFPFFKYNPELVYLDSAATTQKPACVIDAVASFYHKTNVNVHRGSYLAAKSLTFDYETARENIATFIGAVSAKNIAWTQGTTDAINTVAFGWAQHFLTKDDCILLLASEHHANIVPWQQVAKRVGCKIEYVELNEHQTIDISTFKKALLTKPKLVAMQHVSNALGNIYPVEQMCQAAKGIGAKVLIDGAQAIAHLPVNVSNLGCDFYVFSGHKMYGPTGIGVLYAADAVKSDIKPVRFGGEMITKVCRIESSFQSFPAALETGTPNIAGVIGLKSAVEFLQQPSYMQAHEHLASVFQYLKTQIMTLPQIRVFGDTKNNVGVLSFVLEGESVADVGMLLDQQNIAVRCGHHCAMPLVSSLGIDGTIRASLSVYNDKDDVDRLIAALKVVIEMLDLV